MQYLNFPFLLKNGFFLCSSLECHIVGWRYLIATDHELVCYYTMNILMAASVMCKKAVEGLDALCLEVTYGKAALVKTRQEADRLARLMVRAVTRTQSPTAAAPAGEVEAVVRSPTNMAAAKIAAVDFNTMTSRVRPACGHVCWGRSASQWTASNASAVAIGRKRSR